MSKILVLYASKPPILSFLPELQEILSREAFEYSCHPIDPHLGTFDEQKRQILSHLQGVDFIICLGGDGTVLAVASIVYSFEIPILPVNFGQLGFIAEETHASNLEVLLKDIQNNSIYREKRTLLEITREPKGSLIYTALNEVYIGSNNFHRVANFSISVDEYELAQYKADGVLVSTATGSTGYNLSAGGPILHPSLDTFVLTSVVPHRITHRSLILPSHVKVVIHIDNFSQNLVIDGQYKGQIDPGEKVYVQKSPYVLSLLYCSERNYFQSLKKKLNWMT